MQLAVTTTGCIVYMLTAVAWRQCLLAQTRVSSKQTGLGMQGQCAESDVCQCQS